MIDAREALKLKHGDRLHAGTCTEHVGPRGKRRTFSEVWRVNGRVKTWKTMPDRLQVPLKTGFNGPHFYLTQDNLADFHMAFDCPLVKP